MQHCYTKSKSLLFVRLALDQIIRRETPPPPDFSELFLTEVEVRCFVAAAVTWTFKSRLSGTNYTTHRPTLAPVMVGSYLHENH